MGYLGGANYAKMSEATKMNLAIARQENLIKRRKMVASGEASTLKEATAILKMQKKMKPKTKKVKMMSKKQQLVKEVQDEIKMIQKTDLSDRDQSKLIDAVISNAEKLVEMENMSKIPYYEPEMTLSSVNYDDFDDMREPENAQQEAYLQRLRDERQQELADMKTGINYKKVNRLYDNPEFEDAVAGKYRMADVKKMLDRVNKTKKATRKALGMGMRRKGGSIGSQVVGHRGGFAFLPALGSLAATALPYITDKIGDYVSGVVAENKRKRVATKKMLGEIESGEYMKNLNKQLGLGSGLRRKRGGMVMSDELYMTPEERMMKAIKSGQHEYYIDKIGRKGKVSKHLNYHQPNLGEHMVNLYKQIGYHGETGQKLGGAFLGGEYLGGYLPKNLKYVGGKIRR